MHWSRPGMGRDIYAPAVTSPSVAPRFMSRTPWLVMVIGNNAIIGKVSMSGDKVVEVLKVQKALLKVFDRILEVVVKTKALRLGTGWFVANRWGVRIQVQVGSEREN